MGVLTGIGGHVSRDTETPISCVRTWGIAHSAAVTPIVCSGSDGATSRVDGNLDWSGQWTQYGDQPLVIPGEQIIFGGAMFGEGATAKGASGQARVSSIEVAWDQETGAPIGHTISFEGDGVLTIGTITVPADAGVPNPFSSKGLKIEITAPATVPDWTNSEVGQVRNATLMLSRTNPVAYHSGGSGWPERPLGNLDATVNFTVYADDVDGWDNLPKPNEPYFVRLYVDATRFWLIEGVKFVDMTALDVDIETAALVGGTVSGGLDAYQDLDGSGTLVKGKVVMPDGTVLWPAA